MNKEAETVIVKARIALLRTQAFFGTLALRLKMIEDSTLQPPTMAVDGVNIYYHPDFVLECTSEEVKSVLAHEVMHCVFEHMSRVAGRELEIWNIACDYAINPILVEAGFKMPEGALLSNAYRDMTADEIYNCLAAEGKEKLPKPYDLIKPAAKPPAEMKEMEEDWKIATIQAANAAKAAGKLPDSLKRFVDEILATKTCWRSRLRQFATEIAKNDYSWQRINRRYAAMGFYLPGLYSERMGTMVVVTDDSGSIGDRILSLFAGEIASIREAVAPERTIVLSCDAQINHVDDLTMDDIFEMKCHGGGGTDFRPPFTWLEQQGIEPSCLIYLTDLEGPFPETPPSYPVLWCSINKKQAPWGETLHITED